MTTQISNSQIETLRIEAGQAGDAEMVAACDTALGNRTEDAWWIWHDKDSSRWGDSVNPSIARCAAWVAGESDDGPDQDDARRACAEAIAEARAMEDEEDEETAEPYGYAAIGDDGNRPVVWGLGRTEEEAEREAHTQLTELGEDASVERVVPVTEAQYDRINAGDVSAEGL